MGIDVARIGYDIPLILHSSYSYSYIYNLYTVIKPITMLDSPLNKDSLAISA